MKALALVALIAVTGCASQEARRTAEAQHIVSYCQQLGAVQGSPEYWNCVQMVQNRIASGARNATVDRATYAGMAAAGFGMTQRQQPTFILQPRY